MAVAFFAPRRARFFLLAIVALLPWMLECFNNINHKVYGRLKQTVNEECNVLLRMSVSAGASVNGSSIHHSNGGKNDSSSSSNNNSHNNLIEWLKSQGGCSDGVSIFDGKIRGLIASRDAEPGDVLLNVPLDACICSPTPDNTNDNNKSSAPPPASSSEVSSTNNKSNENNKVLLALRVLEDWRNDNIDTPSSPSSRWGPFLNSWPKYVSGLPENIANDDELRREAQCEMMVADTQKYRAWLEDNYYNLFSESATDDVMLLSKVQQSPPVSLEEFRMAMQLVGSRCIRLSSSAVRSSRSTSILVPILDMANHDGANPSAIYRFVQEKDDDNVAEMTTIKIKGSIQLVAKTSLQAGDDVTISYGNHCNRVMAGCYGFVPNANPNDYELVSLIEILQAARDAECEILESLLQSPTNSAGDDLFSVVNIVESSTGLPITNFRLSACTGPDEGLWLALRAALLVLTTNDDGGASTDELLDLLEDIAMDEADEYDLWFESETNQDVCNRAQIVLDACRVLEQTIGGSRYTTIEEDEEILASLISSSDHQQNQDKEDAKINDSNDATRQKRCSSSTISSREVLLQLRVKRKKLFQSVAQEMRSVLEEPDRAKDSIAKLLNLW